MAITDPTSTSPVISLPARSRPVAWVSLASQPAWPERGRFETVLEARVLSEQ